MSETIQAPEATADTVSKKRAIQELQPSRMKECEFERTVYTCTAHENTTPEDLLEPAYWTHVAEKFKPFDKVEARADDGTWYAEYLVLETSRRWTRMHLLMVHSLTTADVSVTQAKLQEFTVEYKGPHKLHCVIRVSDGAILKDELRTKADANAWLTERIKAGI